MIAQHLNLVRVHGIDLEHRGTALLVHQIIQGIDLLQIVGSDNVPKIFGAEVDFLDGHSLNPLLSVSSIFVLLFCSRRVLFVKIGFQPGEV